MQREIILDTETTGLEASPDGRGDRLVEIGCVELIGGELSGNNFHCYLNPGRPMSEEARQIHGISDEFLADKPIFADIAEEFLSYIGDDKLVIHNAEFDMGFINAELQFGGREPLPADRAIDTLAMARAKYPGMRNSLDELCKRLEIDNSERTLHGALLDAELLARVYVKMTRGEQSGFSLAGGKRSAAPIVEGYDIAGRQGLVITAGGEELKRHEEFIAKMDNALWNKVWNQEGKNQENSEA